MHLANLRDPLLATNADLSGSQFTNVDLHETRFEDVNLTEALLCTRAVGPHMLARKAGKFVALDPKPKDRVLEVGTGSGYQAAVLAELVAEVFTIEIIEPLAKRAANSALAQRLGGK